MGDVVMTTLGSFALERMYGPVDKVRQRLLRATATLDGVGVPYAVAGGNAVADWVTRVDAAAVRFTQEVGAPSGYACCRPD